MMCTAHATSHGLGGVGGNCILEPDVDMSWEVDEKNDFDQSEAASFTMRHGSSPPPFPFPSA